MKYAKTVVDFFTRKIWTIEEFVVLSFVIALNPLAIVAIEYIFGVQYLVGVITGCLAFCAIKTQWRKKDA